MINIFFVPGMFGSTVEYCLRRFSSKFSSRIPSLEEAILPDGSLHTFTKEWHPTSESDNKLEYDISTPIYPTADGDFNSIYSRISKTSDSNIVIHADSLISAELTRLFQYYKISQGKPGNFFRQLFDNKLAIFANNAVTDFTLWNSNYTTWEDLQPWEFREWQSIFYHHIADKYCPKVPYGALGIVHTKFLTQFSIEMQAIFDYCNLEMIDRVEFGQFAYRWQAAQQYIVDEFNEIDCYVESSIVGEPYTWTSSSEINIITESIIQSRLRAAGFEIMCDGLNALPVLTTDLHRLLYKVD